MSCLNIKLEGALQSRQRRGIRRRLPSPTRALAPPGSAHLVDFCSNDYLSLSSYAPLRDRFLKKLHTAPDILGSGGSRLLVNGAAHAALEARLAAFFGAPAALLFNSGFDANAGFFACVPQAGDVVVYDEHIHASVHDGLRASRGARERCHVAFAHNDVQALRDVLRGVVETRPGLCAGVGSVIVAVESLYSMDGTFAPLPEVVAAVEEMLPCGNGHVVVDEAHATGLYGDRGRGLVAYWGLEDRVLARLHTFGKALAGSGAIILTSPLIKEYLLNYARPLIYTTSLNNASVIATDCSFDLLEDGTASKMSDALAELTCYTLDLLRQSLKPFASDVVYLPHHLVSSSKSDLSIPSNPTTSLDDSFIVSPIIPIMCPQPRPLSSHLRNLGFNARPITWPTVPKGKDRVRVCLHAGNTKEEVEGLVEGIVQWAEGVLEQRAKDSTGQCAAVLLESKL